MQIFKLLFTSKFVIISMLFVSISNSHSQQKSKQFAVLGYQIYGISENTEYYPNADYGAPGEPFWIPVESYREKKGIVAGYQWDELIKWEKRVIGLTATGLVHTWDHHELFNNGNTLVSYNGFPDITVRLTPQTQLVPNFELIKVGIPITFQNISQGSPRKVTLGIQFSLDVPGDNSFFENLSIELGTPDILSQFDAVFVRVAYQIVQ